MHARGGLEATRDHTYNDCVEAIMWGTAIGGGDCGPTEWMQMLEDTIYAFESGMIDESQAFQRLDAERSYTDMATMRRESVTVTLRPGLAMGSATGGARPA